MFSSTTMESSTRMPMQRARAIVETMFSVNLQDVHHEEGRDERGRDRDEDDEGGAPLPEEEEEDQGRDRDAEEEVAHRLGERGLDEGRLVRGDA